MNITDRLMQLDPSLKRSNEGHWLEEFNPEMSGYSSFNDAGVECEVGELLYSFVRILRPERVLETGTHWGIGASYIGMGLKDNRWGQLDTVEFLPEIYVRAKERIDQMGLGGVINSYLIDAAKFNPNGQYQLMLFDTEPQTRFAELVRFYDRLDEGGYCFIHDLHRHMQQVENPEHGFAWPFGEIPYMIGQLVRAGKLRPFHFGNPRGLTGFYKTSSQDFNWAKQGAIGE